MVWEGASDKTDQMLFLSLMICWVGGSLAWMLIRDQNLIEQGLAAAPKPDATVPPTGRLLVRTALSVALLGIGVSVPTLLVIGPGNREVVASFLAGWLVAMPTAARRFTKGSELWRVLMIFITIGVAFILDFASDRLMTFIALAMGAAAGGLLFWMAMRKEGRPGRSVV